MFERIRENPTGIIKINKKLIVTLTAAALLLVVLFFGINSEKKRNFGNEQKKEIPALDDQNNAEFLNGMPKDYAFLQNIKNTGDPKSAPQASPLPDPQTGFSSGPPNQNPMLEATPPQMAAAPAPIPQGTPDPAYSQKSTIFFTENLQGSRQAENQTPQVQPVAAGLNSNSAFNSEMAASAGLGQPSLNSQEKQQRFFDQKTGANNTSIYNSHLVEDPISPHHVLAGSILPATLITGLNSDLPGEVIAQVRENVYDTTTGKTLLIPQGTKIIGTYDNQINWGQERVMQIWSRLIFPDGSSMVLDGNSGADLAGNSGLGGKVNNHYGKLAGAVLLSAFLSVGSTWSAGDVNSYNPDRKQEVMEDIGNDTNRSGQKIVERQLNVAPTIQVRPGFRFVVMVNRDLILRPYKTL